MIVKVSKFCISLLVLMTLSACSTQNQQVNDEQDNPTRVAEINLQLGLKYLGLKNNQRAKQKLLLALEEAPKLPETNYAMAFFYEATGNMQEANEYYLKAVALAPKRGDVQNNYGTFLCRQGNYHAAIQRFLIAAKDREYLDTAAAYENAGWCALKIPDKKSAAGYFKLAVMNDPDRKSALQEWAKLTKPEERK